MSRVLVTGAGGMIGTKLMVALPAAGHEATGLDLAPGSDPCVAQADLAEWDEGWTGRLRGNDVVIHLAATADPGASWAQATRLNVDATLNVLQAAVLAGVRRMVFASTNWVLAGHRFAEGPLDADTPPAPVNAYGASKLFGERAGLSFHRSHGLSVICLRIGAAQERPDHLPLPDGPQGEWAARIWLSERDLCDGVLRAVEAPSELGFAVLNLMSANPGSRWDLTGATAATGYKSRDSYGSLPGPLAGAAADREAAARAAYGATEATATLLRKLEL